MPTVPMELRNIAIFMSRSRLIVIMLCTTLCFLIEFLRDFVVPLATVIMLVVTYSEQRKTNCISRFESSFWKIGGRNSILNKDAVIVLQDINLKINNHFTDKKTEISMSQLCYLLNYYWRQITTCERINFSFQEYFLVLKTRMYYILKQKGNLIKNNDVPFYIDIVLSELSEDMKLPFFSYICADIYTQKMPKSILNYIGDKIADIINVVRIESPYNCELLDCFEQEDFGYGYKEFLQEHYLETINRLGIK